ncbi:ECs_2282 family putative zinc-binding protein [Pantoea sp. B65]|uniref:ECs_2282 family putative zinc-binding protein n=1 Tax=Pantoea sp. B65 TaxID=2813359 RepID=UPI0039B51EF5
MVMKVRCTSCGSKKFIYTQKGDNLAGHHGAICAQCNKPLTLEDLLPQTKMDPIIKCLIENKKIG